LFHFRYLYTQMKFLTEEADSLGALCWWKKQDMQHLKLKMLLLRKKSPSTTVTFDHISRKQMAFQPDFILEYAHYLHDY
jgi:hypothetical protein